MNRLRYIRFQNRRPLWTEAVDEVLGESWMTARMVAEAISFDVKVAPVREYLTYLASIGVAVQAQRLHNGTVVNCWRHGHDDKG